MKALLKITRPYIIPFIFILPYFILFLYLPNAEQLSWNEWGKVFFNNLWIALFSSLFVLFISFCSALLMYLDRGNPFLSYIKKIIIIPSVLPSLFIIQAVLSLEMLTNFKLTGNLKVIFGLFLMSHGVITLSIFEYLMSHSQNLFKILKIYPKAYFRFFFFLIKDMYSLLKFSFLSVFIFSFSLFSLPFFFGEGKSLTLEVLIFEKIKLNQDWGQALFISALQVLFLGVLLYFTLKYQGMKTQRGERQIIKQSKNFAFLSLFPFFFIMSHFIWQFWTGLKSFIRDFLILKQPLLESLWGSFFVMNLTVIFLLILFLLVILLWTFNKSSKKALLVSAPSVVLLGFSFLLLGFFDIWLQYLFCAIGLSLISFPFLHKNYIYPLLLQNEIEYKAALLMGGSRWRYFFDVLLPQQKSVFFLILLLGLLWAGGDFSLSMILFDRDETLALMSKTFMQSYRLGMSVALLFFIFVLTVVNYYIWVLFVNFILLRYSRVRYVRD